MPRHASLRIHSAGGIPIAEVTNILTTLEETYNSVCLFESLLDTASRYERFSGRGGLYVGAAAFPYLWQARFGHIRDWPPTPQMLRAAVNHQDQLILKSVELHSPGFWEVVGSLNPLETVRKALGDAHERRKDREYRKAEERRKLDLENRLRETELMRKQVDLLKSIGATDADLAPFRNVLVIDPLTRLERLQNEGLLDGTDEIKRDID